jgi:alkanesulfonate monooxygenase SsuD/methylene tetrahydromethanopterin reductase-like flavin-dependent oxidoreductase (luciferase family)
MSVSEDRRRGLDELRAFVASQARWFHRWKDLPQVLQPFKAEFARADAAYDFAHHVSRRAQHNAVVSDELIDVIGILGSAEQCVARIQRLAELGVDRITFINFPGGREEHLRLVGEEVIPRLAAAGQLQQSLPGGGGGASGDHAGGGSPGDWSR